MVNHVRTHLINLTRQGAQTLAGEEYIPPKFVEKQLPPDAKRIYGLLFGADPERLFINYRCRQLMRMLHATELVPHVTLDDPRITYLPFPDEDSDFSNLIGRTVQANTGTTANIEVIGTYTALSGTGRLTQVWQIDVVDSDIVIEQRRPPYQTAVYAWEDILSNPSNTLLPGSSLRLRFPESVMNGERWTVTEISRPQDNLADILPTVMGSLGQLVEQLFPITTKEPQKTWTSIWRSQPNGPLRYAAFILAFSQYISRLPQKRS